jgi:hypothetical protein
MEEGEREREATSFHWKVMVFPLAYRVQVLCIFAKVKNNYFFCFITSDSKSLSGTTWNIAAIIDSSAIGRFGVGISD